MLKATVLGLVSGTLSCQGIRGLPQQVRSAALRSATGPQRLAASHSARSRPRLKSKTAKGISTPVGVPSSWAHLQPTPGDEAVMSGFHVLGLIAIVLYVWIVRSIVREIQDR